MKQQSRLHDSPYSALNQQRAIEIEAALRDIEIDVLCLRLDGVQRATLMHVLERFAERWPNSL